MQKYYVHAKTLLSVVHEEICLQLYLKQLLWYHLLFTVSYHEQGCPSGKRIWGGHRKKGSENNVSFEVFFVRRKRKKNHVQSLCNKRNLCSPKRVWWQETGGKKGDFKNEKTKKYLHILRQVCLIYFWGFVLEWICFS